MSVKIRFLASISTVQTAFLKNSKEFDKKIESKIAIMKVKDNMMMIHLSLDPKYNISNAV